MAESFPTVHRSDDDLFSDDLYERIKRLVTNLKDNPLGIVITGRSNTGKSELLAALMGLNEERKDDSTSSDDSSDDSDSDSSSDSSISTNNSKIVERTFEKDSIKVTIWDCPGLQDGTDDEEVYLKNLKERCGNSADLMLYCIDMSQRRFADEFAVHNSAVDKITRTLGPDIWSHTLVVLTKGNIFAKGLKKKNTENIETEFNTTIQEWKTRFMEALQKAHVDKKVVKKIEVQPAGFYTELHLPGREHWLSNLWSYVFTTPDPDAQAKIMLLNASRLQENKQTLTSTSANPHIHTSADQPIMLTDAVLMAIGDGKTINPQETSTETTLEPETNSQALQLVQKPHTNGNKIQMRHLLGVLFDSLQDGVGLILLSFLKKCAQWKKAKVDLRKPAKCLEAEV